MAEAPPGRLPAHMAVNHFLFDSWVHEHDLMLPRGEIPAVDRFGGRGRGELPVGLASLQAGSTTFLDLRLTSPDLRVGLDVAGEMVHVTLGSAPEGAAVIESQVAVLSIAPPAAKAVRSGEMRPAWPYSITAQGCWRAEVPPISSGPLWIGRSVTGPPG